MESYLVIWDLLMLFADMHLVTGVGKCRDLLPGVSRSGCEADPLTLDYLDKILEIEKPDLAVVAGDLVNGEYAPDAQTVLLPIPYYPYLH